MFKINLVVLFLEYPSEKYEKSFSFLQLFLKDIQQKCNITYIRINNKKHSGKYNAQRFTCLNPRYEEYRIDGDNNEWEFSGWNKGLKFLKESKIPYDAVLFVNDSFVTNSYLLNKELFNLNTLKGCINNNAFVGKIDRLDWNERFQNHLYLLDEADVTAWIRTNVFYMSKKIVNTINKTGLVIYNIGDLNKFISEKYHGRAFLHNCPMSHHLQRQIIAWLTKYWHSAFKLSKETWNLWRMKTLAIINEKMLYRLINRLGFNIYDYSEFNYKEIK